MNKQFLTKVQLRLEVPFASKDRAKSLGAKWDILGGFWYVPHGVDVNLFREWWPESLRKDVESMNERANAKRAGSRTKQKSNAKNKKRHVNRNGKIPSVTGPDSIDVENSKLLPWE